MGELIEALRTRAAASGGDKLLEEAADALEAAREDAERWRAVREMDGGAIYAVLGDCDGMHPELADAAIDQARGKAGGEEGRELDSTRKVRALAVQQARASRPHRLSQPRRRRSGNLREVPGAAFHGVQPGQTGDAEVKLSERLEALLALVGKATPGPLSTYHGDVVDADGVPVMITDYEGDNAAAFAAAVNFFRDHGQALAELARRVEDAPCVTVSEALFSDGSRCGKLVATTHERQIGQRVRLVPEDGQGDGSNG